MNIILPMGSAPVLEPRRPTGRLWAALALLLTGLPLVGHAQGVIAGWALTTGAAPTTLVTGATPGTPTFSSLATLSAGGYSTGRGQGFGPSPSAASPTTTIDGTGWSGTLVRTRYEEFTVTAATGYSVRVDSLIFSTVINNSAAGRIWVSYSTDGFTTLNEITGIVVPAAATATPVGGPSFTTPPFIPNSTNASSPVINTHTYRVGLNSTTGVTVTAGNTVSMRLYYGVASGSARPAYLKSVATKGTVTATSSPCVNAAPAAATSLTFNSATLNFTAGTSTGTSTAISVAPTAGGAAVASGTGVTSPYNLSGLPVNTTPTQYTVTYTTTCTSGTVNTATNTFTTPAAPVCNAPTALTIGSLTATSAQLSFTAGASPSAPGTDNTSYTVSISPGVTGSPTSATSSPINFSGLTAGTGYTVTLTSNCSGNGGVSAGVTRTFLTPVANSTRLQVWSMRVSNADSAAVRSVGVTATTPTLTGFVLADGLTPPNGIIPVPATPQPYSPVFGQAFAPNANGTWGTGATPNPGPGGNLNRAFYEQFTITASGSYAVRMDSVVLTSSFYASSSNTKLALSYSPDGFATSTLESTGGFGPAGVAVTSSFASPIAVPNYLSTAPVTPNPNTYRLALNGTTGVTIAAGQTLTFRLYYSCGSTNTGRYAFLRDVMAKGQATFTPPTCGTPTGLAVGSISSSSASLSFTPGSGGGVTYTVQVTPQGGSTTTISPAPTVSPVSLTGLIASTNYTVTVQANCSVGSLQSSTATTTFATTATVLQRWSLRLIDGDSAAVRNAAVTASSRSGKRLVLSDGTSVPAVPARSAKFGTAVAPVATGLGWSSGAMPPGPGGTPNARFYTQFVVTAAAGSAVRLDAVNYNAAFYNGPANMSVSYSRNGFQTGTDSTSVVSAAVIPNTTTANAITTRTVLNGATGVTIQPGQTLTLRFYPAASTTSNRYFFLRDVSVEGAAVAPAPVGDLTITGTQGISGIYNNIIINSPGVVTISGPLTVNGSIIVNNGGTLNTNCQSLSGAGSFTLAAGGTLGTCSTNIIASSALSGASSLSSDASFVFNGTVPQNTGGLPATVRNLTVNNGGNGLTLSQPLSVIKLVRLTNSNLASNGNLTLLSVRGGGTALIHNEGTGIATGTATMQRAVDIFTPDNIGYHHLSSPVTSAPIEDLQTPGFDFVLNPAYNTAPLAGQVRPFPTVFAYDDARTTSTTVGTDQTAFNKGFFSPAAGSTMPVGRGYTASVPNALLLDFVGTFNNGDVPLAGLTRASTNNTTGYHLLGNPYPAPIDWVTMLSSQFTGGIQEAVYQYHATSRYEGFYTTISPTGIVVVPGSVTNRPDLTNNTLLVAGSGFFAFVPTTVAVGTPCSITLKNANRKTTFAGQPLFGRTSTTRPQLKLQVRGVGLQDELFVYAEAAATAGYDAAFDAAKLSNTNGLNLTALAGTTPLALDALPDFATTSVVPLTLGVPTVGTYILDVTQLANLGTTRAYLRDAVAGTETPLAQGTQVPVTLTNIATATTRFSLVFRAAGALATTGNVLAAQTNVYPNPAHSSFTLLLPPVTGAAKATATLLNALGQVVNTRTLALTAGGATAEYATSGLAAGVYALRVAAGNQATTIRVVVQ